MIGVEKQSANQCLLGIGYDMRIAPHCECACGIGQTHKQNDFGTAIGSIEAESHC